MTFDPLAPALSPADFQGLNTIFSTLRPQFPSFSSMLTHPAGGDVEYNFSNKADAVRFLEKVSSQLSSHATINQQHSGSFAVVHFHLIDRQMPLQSLIAKVTEAASAMDLS
jgi:hypothetical protein